MPPAKPLNVEILRRNYDPFAEVDWVPYQEYGVKAKSSTNSWSCYILGKEGEVSYSASSRVLALMYAGTQQFAVRCTNPTENVFVVRVSVDACYVQQYLLRPTGSGRETVTCDGTGSHTMIFRLVSGEGYLPDLSHSAICSRTDHLPAILRSIDSRRE